MSSINDFLNHQSGSSKTGNLSGWKKTGEIVVWLHTEYTPKPIYVVKLPIPVVFKDKDTKEEVEDVWAKTFVSHDSEKTIKDQYMRNLDGTRKVEPIDPMGRFFEAIFQLILKKKISPFEIVWNAGHDRKGDQRILRAGGVCGFFSSKYGKNNEELKKEAIKQNIAMGDMWQENALPKLNYVFLVVDNAKVDNGLQFATETGLLGDKMKIAIRSAADLFGAANCDPMKTPYAFRWKFLDKEPVPMNKYTANPVSQNVVPLTAGIEELIKSEVPNDSMYVTPYNKEIMRGYVEMYVPDNVKSLLNIDAMFDGVKPKYNNKETVDENGVEQQSAALPKQAVKPVSIPTPLQFPQSPKQAVNEAPTARRRSKQVEIKGNPIACDECKKTMGDLDPICPHCGCQYEIDEPATTEKADDIPF